MIALEPNQTYHIYNHANGDDNLFRNEENYAYFLKRYAHFICPIAKTYAYCLMPNHFHLLVKIRSEEEILIAFPSLNPQGFENLEGFSSMEKAISQQFSNFFNSYSKSFNKYYNRRGALFCQNFKRKPVQSDAYFTSVVQYIHRNPVHHGFCKNVEDWNWSSYHAILSNKKTLLEKDELIDWFGNTAHFVEAHAASDDFYAELAEDDFY